MSKREDKQALIEDIFKALPAAMVPSLTEKSLHKLTERELFGLSDGIYMLRRVASQLHAMLARGDICAADLPAKKAFGELNSAVLIARPIADLQPPESAHVS